jgi:hypothetical protein
MQVSIYSKFYELIVEESFNNEKNGIRVEIMREAW